MQTMVNASQNTSRKNNPANTGFGANQYVPLSGSQRGFAGAPRHPRFASLHGGLIPRAMTPDIQLPSGPVSGGHLTLVEHTGGRRSDPLKTPAPVKPKRKAMKLRLEQPSHRQLRLAGAHTGRTCQDILFTAMHLYLDELA